jgi:gluconate kinase
LIDGPGRRGHPAGHLRERPDGKVYPVRWHDNTTSSVPEYDLDQVAAHRDDVFSVLKNKRFGRLNDLRRNLTFVYLSGKLANVVYSTDTTNTDFYAYQYEPVLTFLESPAGGILIAAEVGLGKTIEAGLIWTELRARYDARRLVVVCPAMLREKWCDELRERFGVDAVQLSASELVNELKRNKHRRRRGGFRVQPARSATAQGLEKP